MRHPTGQGLRQTARHGQQAQHGGGGVQRGQRCAGVERRGAGLFGEFFALRVAHQRRVQVARRGQAQLALQQNLARRVVGQVFAPHHIGDALRRVIHHHCELVSKAAIGAFEHKVAHLGRNILLLGAEPAVLPADDATRS